MESDLFNLPGGVAKFLINSVLNTPYQGQPCLALREESSQTNVILQYKLLEAILSAVCSVIQQS